MTGTELNEFFDKHQDILWYDDIDRECMAFRIPGIKWYDADENNMTVVKWKTLAELSPEALMDALTRGLKVVSITRVTGYFSVVDNWNAGKRQELKDRTKYTI